MAAASKNKAASEKPKAVKPAATKPAPRLSPEDLDVDHEEADEDEDELEGSQESSPAADPKSAHQGKNDYLWPYEFNQVTGLPFYRTPGLKYHAPAKGSKAEIMKFVLLAQPKIRTLVPRVAGEKKSNDVPQTVCLNGYRLDFPKGRYVTLPEQVANRINKSYEQTETALDQFRIDGDSEKESAFR